MDDRGPSDGIGSRLGLAPAPDPERNDLDEIRVVVVVVVFECCWLSPSAWVLGGTQPRSLLPRLLGLRFLGEGRGSLPWSNVRGEPVFRVMAVGFVESLVELGKWMM